MSAGRPHRAFWFDLLTKIGVPIFAATLVGCLLQEEFRATHGILLGVGLVFIYMGHRADEHGG